MKRTTLLFAVAALLLSWTSEVAHAQVQWFDSMLNGFPQTVNGWTWIPIAGAKCRHGTNTGIAYRKGTDPSKLLVTMEDGGACFNGATCAINPPIYGFDELKAATSAGKQLTTGIWSTAVSDSFTATYSQVFIPYCSGDFFAGARENVRPPGVDRDQSFVGYKNMELYINYIVKRLLPTGSRPEVKLAGISAGGFGAQLNAPRLRAKLPATMPMSLLLDSSPPMLFPGCQQERFAEMWNLTDTVIRDCNGGCTAKTWIDAFFQNLLASQQAMGIALVSTTYDLVVRSFQGFFGDPVCVRDPSEAAYTSGLLRLREQMHLARGDRANTAVYIIPSSTNHMFLNSGRYFSTAQDNVPLRTWVEWQFDHSGAYPYLPAYYTDVGLIGQMP